MTTPTLHPHPHEHPDHHHEQDHHHPAGSPLGGESYPHVRGGPPVLDIGGDIGALLVTMNPNTAGTELHLRSEHQPPTRIHTGIWHRTNGDRQVTTAVFPELPQGAYWVLDSTGTDLRRVTIRGGALTRLDLRR
jgi:hypothetical protein